jgi:hypothetical protein
LVDGTTIISPNIPDVDVGVELDVVSALLKALVTVASK